VAIRFTVRLLLIILIALICASCGSEKSVKVEYFDFNRLVGLWQSHEGINNQIEEWNQISDGLWTGKGYVKDGIDTTFIEFLTIEKNSASTTFYTQINDLSTGEKVPFVASIQSKDRVEFINPDYSFPKKIVYEMKSDKELLIYIEGPLDGRTTRIPLKLSKQ
jgi:hypothetical protein